jgi:hypothetical protein
MVEFALTGFVKTEKYGHDQMFLVVGDEAVDEEGPSGFLELG